MPPTDALLPYGEVRDRLRILGQRYVGVQTIPVDRIAGSVDRMVDFDRFFRPRRRELRDRVKTLRAAFERAEMPPISVYEVGGLYFVIDGHHRVALARDSHMEFMDAEITAIATSHRLPPDVDIPQLIHTEQHRIFMERSGLEHAKPDESIEVQRPTGYADLLEIVEEHAYQLSVSRGEVVPIAQASADWFATEFLPALNAIRAVGLVGRYAHKTNGDLYLWVSSKLRELRTTNRDATWADAAEVARRERVPLSAQRALKQQRRSLLPPADRGSTTKAPSG
jgi:hypothetical protein